MKIKLSILTLSILFTPGWVSAAVVTLTGVAVGGPDLFEVTFQSAVPFSVTLDPAVDSARFPVGTFRFQAYSNHQYSYTMNVSFLDSRLSPDSAALTGLIATADTTAVVTFPGSALIHYAFAGQNGYFRLALETTSLSGSILESGTASLYAHIEPFSFNSGFTDTPEPGSFRVAAAALAILITSVIGRSR